MNNSIYKFSLDIHETLSQVVIELKQNDTAREFLISLTENGRPYIISENCYAVFTAKKPDGKIIYNDCVIDGNVIRYTTTPQSTSTLGESFCEIKLYGENDALLTSPAFSMLIYAPVYQDGDVIESSNEFSALANIYTKSNLLYLLLNRKHENGEFQGEDGDSAYDIAIKNGFVGTEGEWLESLKGGSGLTEIPDGSITPEKLDREYATPEFVEDEINDAIDKIAVSGGQVQADYAENDVTSPRHILNREFYREMIYDGGVYIPLSYTDDMTSSSELRIGGVDYRFVKVADFKHDHNAVISQLSAVGFLNVLSPNQNVVKKLHRGSLSVGLFDESNQVIQVIATNSSGRYGYQGFINGSSVNFDFILPEAGLYVLWNSSSEFNSVARLLFDPYIKKIDKEFIPENFATKEYVDGKFNDITDDNNTGELEDGAVTPEKIAPNAVTTEKLEDGAVTPEKLDREYATPEDVTKAIEGIEFPENDITVEVPTKLSDLEDDETHRTVTDSEKNTWNKKSDFSGNYSDLNGLPEIPSTEGLATEDFVVEKVNKATTFEEISLPDNFEGYTDVIHLSEPLSKDWSKVKIWSADDGLIIPESRSPYDFDYSLIPETNYAEIGNLPSSLDLKILPEESMGGSIVLVDENKPAFVMINFVKGDNLRQPLTITANFLDFTLVYLSVGESISSYIDFTATEEGWYVYKGDDSVFVATEKDLSVFSGTYKNLKILDWGSFNVDMMKELGVNILGTEYLLKLFVKNLISFTCPPGYYSAKTPTAKKPVKGVDYFTKEDKSEFVDSVLAALPMWEGGSY